MKGKHVITAIALAVSAGVSSHASAIVPSWDYNTNSGFFFDLGNLSDPKNPTCTPGFCGLLPSEGDTPATRPNNWSRLQWGNPQQTFQSGAQIFNGTSGTTLNVSSFLGLVADDANGFMFEQIVTDSMAWTTTSISAQYNNIITGAAIQTGVIDTLILLDAPGGPAGPEFGIQADLAFDFDETVNENDIANCDPPNLANTRCDDILTLDKLPSGATTGVPFSYAGVNYIFQTRLIGFGTSGSVVDDTTDPLRNIVYTPENAPGISYLITQSRVFTRPDLVPAPGALALLGIGLFGMGMRLRKQARS